MRKEVIFAIIIGLILGFVILFGWKLANQSAKQAASSTAPTPMVSASPSVTVTPPLGIIISSPQNHAVVNTSSVKIIGKTQPNSSIAISDTEDDTIVTADKEGNFTTDLKITGGANLIKLTALKSDLTLDQTTITVIYSTAKIDSAAGSAQSSDTPVASAEAIKDDVNRRIREAIDKNLKNVQDTNLLVGYAGTISNIKQGVFTLNANRDVLQVSLSSSTTIIKDNKPLKPELISLEDYAVVIGNLTSPDILSAKRIVISSKNGLSVIEKRAVYSPIIKIKNNILTLKVDDKNLDVVLGKKLKLDPKTLTLDNKIFGIVIGSVEPTGPTTLLQAKLF